MRLVFAEGIFHTTLGFNLQRGPQHLLPRRIAPSVLAQSQSLRLIISLRPFSRPFMTPGGLSHPKNRTVLVTPFYHTSTDLSAAPLRSGTYYRPCVIDPGGRHCISGSGVIVTDATANYSFHERGVQQWAARLRLRGDTSACEETHVHSRYKCRETLHNNAGATARINLRTWTCLP